MWDDQTWGGFCALLDSAWPGELGEDAAEAYRTLLDDVEPIVAVRALKALLRTCRFRPSAAEIVQLVDGDPSRPTFDEAYAVLFSVGGPLRRRTTDEAVQDALDRYHPLIARFIQLRGRDYLAYLELEDPEWGGAKRTELRRAWDQMVDAVEGRDVAALVAGTGSERGVLDRVDPLAALGMRRRELAAGDPS